MTSQENNGKVVTQCPTRKASLGWINGKLCICTVHEAEEMASRPVDAGRWWTQRVFNHSPNWVTVGKAKQKGGSEMGKYPPCQKEWWHQSASLMWNTPAHQKKNPHCLWRGGFIPYIHKEEKPNLAKEPELTAGAWGHAPQMKRGYSWITPEASPGSLGWTGLKNYPHKMLNCKTVLLIIKDCDRQFCYTTFIYHM